MIRILPIIISLIISTTPTSQTTASDTSNHATSIPVLMYHNFFNDKNGTVKGKDNNCLPISKFGKQLKYLSDNDYYFPTWDEVYGFVEGANELPEKSIVITVDDGYKNFYKYALPILTKYRKTATLFVITGKNKSPASAFFSPFVLTASHTHKMHDWINGKGIITSIPQAEGVADMRMSLDMVENKTAFAYPYGHYNENAKQILKKAGIKLAFTIEYARIKPNMDKLELPRIRMNGNESISSFIAKVK